MADLPINVEVSAAYLDGVMECEPQEIRKQWQVIRQHLADSAHGVEALEILRRMASLQNSHRYVSFDGPLWKEADAIVDKAKPTEKAG